MVDAWSVPLNNAGINDLNDTIAKGHDLSWIGNLPDAFWKGQEQKYTQGQREYTQNQQNLFKDGIPGDLATVIQQYAKVKGADALPQIVNLAKLQYGQQANQNAFPQDGAPSSTQFPPSISRPGGTVQPQGQSQEQPQPGADIPTGTPMPPGQNLGNVTGVDRGPVETAGPAGFQTDPQIQPRPVQTVQYTPQNPQGAPTRAQEQPQPGGDPTLGGLVPASFVQRYGPNATSAYVNLLSGYVSSGMLAPEQAKNYQSRIDAIQGALTKNAEIPPDVKTYNAGRNPGEALPEYQQRVEAMKTQGTEDVKNFNKDFQGIQNLGRTAVNGQQMAQLGKSLTLQPGFYSGPWHEGVQTYNQFKATFGPNASAATPMEALDKVANNMLIEQVRAMGGSGVGRVLQSEVNAMKATIANKGITPQTNRALLEMANRTYQWQQGMADYVKNVPRAAGRSQQALDEASMAYAKQHPIFSPEELQNPTLLGAPDAPPQSAQWNPQQKQQWARSVGLKSGDPIRFNGNLAQVP